VRSLYYSGNSKRLLTNALNRDTWALRSLRVFSVSLKMISALTFLACGQVTCATRRPAESIHELHLFDGLTARLEEARGADEDGEALGAEMATSAVP